MLCRSISFCCPINTCSSFVAFYLFVFNLYLKERVKSFPSHMDPWGQQHWSPFILPLASHQFILWGHLYGEKRDLDWSQSCCQKQKCGILIHYCAPHGIEWRIYVDQDQRVTTRHLHCSEKLTPLCYVTKSQPNRIISRVPCKNHLCDKNGQNTFLCTNDKIDNALSFE